MTTAKNKSAFEIRVAFLGNSDCGKMTTLNALMRENYSTATMSKRKAGSVISYNVHVGGVNENSGGRNADLAMAEEENITLKDGGEKINTITYNVDIEKEIVPMRSQTQFCFTVIPGVAQDTTKHQKYVTEKWNTFDAIVVVMDGKKGISDDDVTLLKLVKENLARREIPAIILCNKIDSADDEKLARHAAKAQAKVEKIFSQIAEGAAELIIRTEPNEVVKPSKPSFIPCSALHAFAYRAGARLTVYQFEEFDPDLMDCIGKVHFGSKTWKKMTHEERFRKTHAILADPKQFKDGMSDCGYDKVMTDLEHFLGGVQTQEHLIQKQIDHSLYQLSPFQSEWISYTLFSAYQKQVKLSAGSIKSNENDDVANANQLRLREAFWTTFEEYQAGTFQKFVNAFPANIHMVADPLQELMYYHKLVLLAKWEGEEKVVVNRMKLYVQHYIQFLIRHEHETQGNSSWSATSTISPIDWSVIWRSILLLSFDKTCCEFFGRAQIICQTLAREADNWKANRFNGIDKNCPRCHVELEMTKKKPFVPRCKGCLVVYLPEEDIVQTSDCFYCGNGNVGETHQCANCKYMHLELLNLEEWLRYSYAEDGELVPANVDKYQKVVHLEILDSLDDPRHFGHPLYKFSNFVATLTEKKVDEQNSARESNHVS